MTAHSRLDEAERAKIQESEIKNTFGREGFLVVGSDVSASEKLSVIGVEVDRHVN